MQQITIFAKKKTTKEGKAFTAFVARMKKKDGTEIPCSVRFNQEVTPPAASDCPMNIIIDREYANMSSKDFTYEDTGETGTSYTLWVKKLVPGDEYVDTSLDEFEGF